MSTVPDSVRPAGSHATETADMISFCWSCGGYGQPPGVANLYEMFETGFCFHIMEEASGKCPEDSFSRMHVGSLAVSRLVARLLGHMHWESSRMWTLCAIWQSWELCSCCSTSAWSSAWSACDRCRSMCLASAARRCSHWSQTSSLEAIRRLSIHLPITWWPYCVT